MATKPDIRFRMTPRFEKWVEKNGLQGEPFDELVATLQQDPTTGDVIPGTGGLRKIRMAGAGRGKRGGFRVVYTVVVAGKWVVFLRGYSKSEMAKLPEREQKRLRKLADQSEADILASLQNQTPEAGE